ncbi:MAG: AAA family ATPase [Candidatus Thorarchaeota archaeon]|jgi:O-phosphoseryl-tRNA(Sec) kinase
MNQFLLAICGIPASGKTTFSKLLCEKMLSFTDVRIVSTDHWRDAAFYANFEPEKERAVRKIALEKVSQLASEGLSVIHDDTNYYASMRHELYEVAKRQSCAFAVVYITTPLETVKDWNRQREIIVPEAVLVRINAKLDPPGTKYTWDRAILQVDLSKTSLETAVDSAITELKSVKPISVDAATHDISENLLDISTRDVVAKFLIENPGQRTNQDVHDLRKTLLSKARMNNWSTEEVSEVLKQKLDELNQEQ